MIELMKESDLSEVLQLENELFTSPWSYDSYLYDLKENPYSSNFIFRIDGKIAGYCGLWCLFEQAQITNIAVNKIYQRQHIGTKLMEYMEKIAIKNGCETISLEVRVSNDAAINLYKKNGYEIISVRKGYYQDNHEDAWLMMKGIGGIV